MVSFQTRESHSTDKNFLVNSQTLSLPLGTKWVIFAKWLIFIVYQMDDTYKMGDIYKMQNG